MALDVCLFYSFA
ncbi:hypothetical protein O1B73_003471 [Vibrio cholerae]|nr:hypothetical protein [Vibrio cholerae]